MSPKEHDYGFEDDCPFPWDGTLHVSRWNGTETDGPNSEFERRNGCLVRKDGKSRNDLWNEQRPKSARSDHDPKTINFGKHKGKKWDEIPRSYLNWINRNHNDKAIRRMATAELQKRKGKPTKAEIAAKKHRGYQQSYDNFVKKYYKR